MKRILFLLVSTLLSVMFIGAPTAQAAYANPITICNYWQSDDSILAYNHDTNQSWNIIPNDCVVVNDANGMARVDVDPSGGAADIDSWKKRKVPDSWGPCYNNEDGSSNPYSGYQQATTYYTYFDLNCRE